MKSFINGAQAAVLSVYATGDFQHLAESESNDDFVDEYETSGDGLLRFLMVELADKEGCDSVTEGLNRVQAAINDLETVKRMMEKCLDQFTATYVRLTLVTREGRTGQVVIGSKAPMVWDNADGEDETVSATFDLFRIGRPGEIEIIERFAIDGDQWRMLECKGSVNVIPTRVRLGMELSKVVTEEISLG